MSTPILATKLYIPPPRPKAVARPRLIQQLHAGVQRKLSLLSAPAGFGKTSVLAEWIAQSDRPTAWLALDSSDSDLGRFLSYLVAAIQTIAPTIGTGLLTTLQAPQPPPLEVLLTILLNDLVTISEPFLLVLDDYHTIDSQPINQALTFLIKHLPPPIHIIIATREDPGLPLANLRARNQLTELRVRELRFTVAEIADFFNQVLGKQLAPTDLLALEARTEGWIAGLQLAALSMQGHPDTSEFIRSFTGSHHFVLDYLVTEVLQQQPEQIQDFLLRTSILERMCGSLCAAVIGSDDQTSGQQMLEQLEAANLFIVPLDNQRHWYRYHHLFAELLRQRLKMRMNDHPERFFALHVRASSWYETQGLIVEAFQHAVAAGAIDRAARLVEGDGMPLPFRGVVRPVLNWLESLPPQELDARPALWVIYASTLLFAGQIGGVEAKLQVAEQALQGSTLTKPIRNLIGHIAAIRAVVAATQHQWETITIQAQRALEYLDPENIPVRTATTWVLGYAYHLQGDRVAARQTYSEAITTSEKINHTIITIMASIGLGNIQKQANQLHEAWATFQRVLQLSGDPPIPVACEAYAGLAQLCYEWNDLELAQQHAQRSIQLAQQIENTDRFVEYEIFLARLQLVQGDFHAATARLAHAEQLIQQYHFTHCVAAFAALRIQTMLHQNHLQVAAQLAQDHQLLLSQAQVTLAQAEPAAALKLLHAARTKAEQQGWADQRLAIMLLQVRAYAALGEQVAALQLLSQILLITQPQGFIRSFVDQGPAMAQLLAQITSNDSTRQDYITTLLAAFDPAAAAPLDQSALIEPLSERELEILILMAQGLSNQQIAEQLVLALSTVKGHNRNIFGKLEVQRRTEAVARARELGLL